MCILFADSGWTDPATGVGAWIDQASWVDLWVINELFGRLNKEGIDVTESPVAPAQVGGIIDVHVAIPHPGFDDRHRRIFHHRLNQPGTSPGNQYVEIVV